MNALDDLQFNNFPGTKLFRKAQINIREAETVQDVLKILNSCDSFGINFAHINTKKSDFEPFLSNKLAPRETWDTIQFRTPVKGVEHPYIEKFPVESTDNNMEQIDEVCEPSSSKNSFTSSLDEEEVDKIHQASFQRGSFSSFWDELNSFK